MSPDRGILDAMHVAVVPRQRFSLNRSESDAARHVDGLRSGNALKIVRAQVALLRDSFRLLLREERRASERFYARLFEIAPDLRPLFPADMSDQGMKFMSAMGMILQHLDQPGGLGPHLDNLARGHARYGVKPEHFRPMGRALIDTMREMLGDDMPEGAELAWVTAYQMLAAEMTRRAG